MKRPYFSIVGAAVCGVLTVFFVLTFLFSRGPEDALVPFFSTIWAAVFGILFVFFIARVVRLTGERKRSRPWWERVKR